jgi:phospholipid/cholesterol/gamma-HCH transport system substrate-binding protein
MVILKNASAGLNENMEAAKLNFLLKGYFKKKKKEEDKKKKEIEEKKKEAEENKQNATENNANGDKGKSQPAKEGVEKAKG